jgi:hypothetical protein
MRIQAWLVSLWCGAAAAGCQEPPQAPESTGGIPIGDDDDTTDSGLVRTLSQLTGFRAIADGIVFYAPTCDEANEEVCNARDDNCDGVIDEGCGVEGGGGVQVVLRHFDAADVALSVESPAVGHVLNRDSEDPDYNGTFYLPKEEPCVFTGDQDYVQGAHWPDPGTPNGTYRVDVAINTGCDAFDGDIDLEAVVGISVGGEFIGSFRFPQTVGELAVPTSMPVLEFEVE